jgi:hypothetical protein
MRGVPSHSEMRATWGPYLLIGILDGTLAAQYRLLVLQRSGVPIGTRAQLQQAWTHPRFVQDKHSRPGGQPTDRRSSAAGGRSFDTPRPDRQTAAEKEGAFTVRAGSSACQHPALYGRCILEVC